MAVAFLREQSLGRILAGHPWVYAADIIRIEKPPVDGAEIAVRTHKGGYVGNSTTFEMGVAVGLSKPIYAYSDEDPELSRKILFKAIIPLPEDFVKQLL